VSTFDRFAHSFTWWAETANPKRYDELIGRYVPDRIENALDVGCGPGFLAEWLAARATRVTGLDMSLAMVRIARARAEHAGIRNVQYTVGDIERAPFAPATFDLVVSDTAIHDTDHARSLSSIRSLVEPGGIVIIRDIITFNPGRAASSFWQLMGTVRNIPAYMGRHGLVTTARLLRFEASPTWVRHRAEGGELTPDQFEEVYGRLLPGSTYDRRAWFMSAVWKAPE
jgi:2-polyprenyl-3-methyl-5-hydroxy-6-metoxy-1,4-benzoquinol methylase